MLPRAIPVIFALAACGTPPAVPGDVTLALLDDANTADSIRVETTGGEVSAWTLPISPTALPERARRVVEAVQPGGSLAFAGVRWKGAQRQFVVEKIYSEHGGERRSVLVTPAGAVVQRSHTIALGDAPSAVRDALREAPVRLEFVQGNGPDRYRAQFGDIESSSRYVEVAANGSVVRRAVTRQASVTTIDE